MQPKNGFPRICNTGMLRLMSVGVTATGKAATYGIWCALISQVSRGRIADVAHH